MSANLDYKSLKSKALTLMDELNHSVWVRVGGGSSGQAVGSYNTFYNAQEIAEDISPNIKVSLVGTLGMMHREPVLDITKNQLRLFFEKISSTDVRELLAKSQSSELEALIAHKKAFAYSSTNSKEIAGLPNLCDIPEWKAQTKVATRNFGNIDPREILHYIAVGGYSSLNNAINGIAPESVLEVIKDSKLRGRGGAAFPAGLKWSFLINSTAPQKFVLCNCEEGDPGAFNDKGILENDPHTLLEGLIINGYATRSHKGYVFIRYGHSIPIDNMQYAIDQAYEYGLLGANILGSNFSFDVEIAFTGDSYVAGEETAMMEAIEGKRATPRFKPPFPAQSGLWGKPTNINNVKTLSYVPWILDNGAEKFKQLGTEKSSGTAIVCLSGHINRPGLYEVAMGMTIKDVLYKVGGGAHDGKKIKFLQTGGPLGGIMGSEMFDTRIDFDEMSAAGAILGSGGIIVADQTTDVVDITRNLIAFNQFESCGKCFPCRLGNTHMLDILDRMCKNEALPKDIELIEKIGKDMQAGSLCGHGQLGFKPVASAIRYFSQEFNDRLQKRLPTSGPFEDGSFIFPTRTRI